MKTTCLSVRPKRGLTILEMTIVLMVLLALIKMGMSGVSSMDQWRLGRAASETLRTVYSAQRMYLADHPTTLVSNLTEANIISYLPNANPTALPATLAAAFQTVKPLSGVPLAFNVAVSPPQFTQGGVRYDPSGGLTDSLWDVGE